MLSKVEIDILQHLKMDGLFDQMNSRTIKNISSKIGINYFRVRTNVNHLYLLDFVKKGFKEKSSNTFYISEKGVEVLNEQN